MADAQLCFEIPTASDWCQRWTTGAHTWRHTSEGGFDPSAYTVAAVDETTAKGYVCANHYSGSYGAAQHRYGLRSTAGDLLGVAVFGVPMQAAVLTNTFPELRPMVESTELSRLVLADAVPANAESWFLARCFEDLAARDVRGVVTFADPVPRQVAGRLLFAGHVGTIYQASNAVYTGRSTARTLTVLPDGRVLSDRSAQKVRTAERGHEHVERMLVRLGATAPHAGQPGAAWLAQALDQVGATRLRHGGNHRYAFALGSRSERRQIRIAGDRAAYPKKAA